jgi:DNA-binding GntR family transcriptional regulator
VASNPLPHSLQEAPPSRRDDAYERLLSAIIFGDLAPGAVVDEKALARNFSLGLASVRDALFRLSLEGLVERHARIATRIPDLSVREMQDLFEARIMVEANCAGLAAERASLEQVTALTGSFAGYGAAIAARDYRSLVRMDQVFHRSLAAATHNRSLEQQLITLHNAASRFWYFGIPRLNQAALCADIEAHLQIAAAIARRDAASAVQGMRDLLGLFPDNVRFFLSRPTMSMEVFANDGN